MSEAQLREALGGLPALVASLEPGPLRTEAAQLLLGDWLRNPLPADLVDGLLITLLRPTQSAHALYFHGARLLARGAEVESVRRWLLLDGWHNPAQLAVEWRKNAHPILTMKDLSGLDDARTLLFVRTATATALLPSLSAPLLQLLAKRCDQVVLLGLHRLRTVWAGLSLCYARHDPDPSTDPVVGPHKSLLDGLVREFLTMGHAVPVVAPRATQIERQVSEELGVTLLESIPIGVTRLDAQGCITYENPAMRRLMDHPEDRPSAVIGTALASLPNVRATGFAGHLDALVQHGTPFDLRRVEFTTLVGTQVLINSAGRPIRDRRGKQLGSVMLSTDVQREVELENQLIEAQKLELFGTLVGGIAHDINNLLVGVRGNASLLRERLQDGDPSQRIARRLDEATERLSVVVDGLLALARRRDLLVEDTADVRAVLAHATEFLGDLLPAHVHLQLAASGPSLWSSVGPAHLEQVFVNLCVNARDAILAWDDARPGRIDVSVATHEQRVVIRIQDDGVGMDEATRQRAFEPLFTTKPEGQGTGLGLSVSRAIVEAYDGRIDVESTLGAGSCFVVELRAAAAPPPETDAHEAPHEETSPGQLPILLIEDNPVVRTLCEEVLTSCGYPVVSAEKGTDAIRLARTRRFALALVDVGLPDMNGLDVADIIAPLPVLIVSGTPPEDFEARQAGRTGPMEFVKKPFQIPDLLSAIQALVG